MKYITYEYCGRVTPVLFGEYSLFTEVKPPVGAVIRSAGFCEIDIVRGICVFDGRSEELGIGPHPDDALYLNGLINGAPRSAFKACKKGVSYKLMKYLKSSLWKIK